jgi:ppGpp synthetase/RelA/SpoT-type nucleotidyltranferase
VSEGNPNAEVIDPLLEAYAVNHNRVALFGSQLMMALESSSELQAHVHSMKTRLKDPGHLADKLGRKIAKCEATGDTFDITPDNLLAKINDLAGVRILHLYTRQVQQIDAALRSILVEQKYELVEGPFARTWDDESREFFQSCGIDTQESPTMYTSVHYIVSSASRTAVTCEIQVRTLMEEVWGEVDHMLNYPVPTDVMSSREQLKVLARVTSSATRLVDSIFMTHTASGVPLENATGTPGDLSDEAAGDGLSS